MNIYEKLQQCRCELQSQKLKKSGKNKFANYEYFELTDFLPTINKLFRENKLFSNFSITNELATLTIINAEETSENIVFTSPIKDLELKGCNSIQALGGTHTYLKRYLYINALEIVENDLFDSLPQQEEKPQKTVTKPTTPINKHQEVKESEQTKAIFDDIQLIADIDKCNSIDDLAKYFKLYQNKVSKDSLQDFIDAKDRRKKELNQQ